MYPDNNILMHLYNGIFIQIFSAILLTHFFSLKIFYFIQELMSPPSSDLS